MTDQSEQQRPVRVQEIIELLESIDKLIQSKPKCKPLNDDATYYIFANYKSYVIAGSTKPEFVAKTSPAIKHAINKDLIGFGPLLAVQSNIIQQDYQPTYKAEYDEYYYYYKALGAFDIRKQWKQQTTKNSKKAPNSDKQPIAPNNDKQQIAPII